MPGNLSLNFISVAKGDTPVAPQPAQKPTLYIASDLEKARAFLPSTLDPSVTTQLQNAAGQEMLIVTVYRGEMPTSGYGIVVQSVTTAGDQVKIVAQSIDPASDQMVNQVTSYPYHIILIPKGQLPMKAGTVWSLLDPQGKLATEVTYP